MIRIALPLIFLCSITFATEAVLSDATEVKPAPAAVTQEPENIACVSESSISNYAKSEAVEKMTRHPVKVKAPAKYRKKATQKKGGYSMLAVRKNLKANDLLVKTSKEEIDSFYDDETSPGPSVAPAPGTLPNPHAAKDAGPWLYNNGFVNLLDCPKYAGVMNDPKNVPKGAVIVYVGGHLGHIEIKTASGFWSDTPRTGDGFAPGRKVIGVYIKPVN